MIQEVKRAVSLHNLKPHTSLYENAPIANSNLSISCLGLKNHGKPKLDIINCHESLILVHRAWSSIPIQM